MADKTVREVVLEGAKLAVLGDRNTDYGSPENNFNTIAKYWNVYLQSKYPSPLTAVDVAIMMSLMKHSRLATSPAKLDNWVDIAGYAACGAECVQGQPVPDKQYRPVMEHIYHAVKNPGTVEESNTSAAYDPTMTTSTIEQCLARSLDRVTGRLSICCRAADHTGDHEFYLVEQPSRSGFITNP